MYDSIWRSEDWIADASWPGANEICSPQHDLKLEENDVHRPNDRETMLVWPCHRWGCSFLPYWLHHDPQRMSSGDRPQGSLPDQGQGIGWQSLYVLTSAVKYLEDAVLALPWLQRRSTCRTSLSSTYFYLVIISNMQKVICGPSGVTSSI